MCVRARVCIPEYINTICSVHVMLLVCTFPGLIIWCWLTDWCALPWGRLSPTLGIPWLSIVLCLGLRPPELAPLHVRMTVGVILVQLVCRQPCW